VNGEEEDDDWMHISYTFNRRVDGTVEEKAMLDGERVDPEKTSIGGLNGGERS